MSDPKTCRYQFSFQSSWFIDYAQTARQCPGGKLTTQPNLGLLEHNPNVENGATEGAWPALLRHVRQLNEAKNGARYKIVYVTRHGRGVHNVVMDEVGSRAWKTQWSKVDGDRTRTWFDAELVEEGREQIKSLSNFFSDGVHNLQFPLPQSIYTSPLARCLETTKILYQDICAAHGTAFIATVVEYLRERLTTHTCDRRRTREWIASRYPEYRFEEGLFSNEDTLWLADRPETPENHMARTQELLEDIWDDDGADVISLTTHSYTITTLLDVMRVPDFRVAEGAMVAFLIKGE